MAYNRVPGRYQQVQHQTGPQAYPEHDGYGQGQYSSAPDYQGHGGQRYNGYQQEAYGSNQQYDQGYDEGWQQEQNRSQYQAGMNGRPPAPEAQPRSYQYDDRYRQNGRQGPVYEGRDGPAPGRRSPQSRPGTSASGRRTKQDRILDTAELDSPKAMAWDNPFGVFPGTKKDAELKKKAAEEARSKSRAETPSDRPMTAASSSRPPTSAGAREANEPTMTNRVRDEGRPQPSQSARPNYAEDNGPSNGRYGMVDNMPLRKNRAPINEPQFEYGMPDPNIDPNPRNAPQSLPTRPAPQRSATGPTPGQQPLSPTAVPAAYNTRPSPYQQQDEYFQQNPQEPPNGRREGYLNGSYGAPTNASYQEYQADSRGYQQHPSENAMYTGQERREQPAARSGPQAASDDHEYVPMPGAFEYRGVTSSRSMTDLHSDPAMPNFAEMPANATESIEKQVTLQAQQPHSAYRKPVYGDTASRLPPTTSAQRAPVRPGLVQDQMYPDHQYEPGAVSPGEYAAAAPAPRQNPARSPPVGRDPRAEPRSPTAQYGDYSQPQFPPRKGSRPDQRGPGPVTGFRHPYNQPIAGRPGPQHQKSPPRGAPYGNQPPPQGRRPPRQEYGFDNQGYPSGNKYMPDPYHEDPIHETYPREQAHPPVQPPHLARSQTEPVYPSHEEPYDQYNRGPPQGRTQPFDAGYNQQPPSPSRTRRQQQYDQSQGYGQNPYSAPGRPRTANAVNAPGRPYPDQGPPRSRPPNSGFPVADRNHPIPFRPGLMSPPPGPPPTAQVPNAPPPQPQVSPPREQQSSGPQIQGQSVKAPKQPVTNAELSGLRDAFGRSPSNDKLGLQFAKKLVEAGSVLANEGGRADAKQTARNRERYINDAYKVIKKLVGNGSSEAMFYLADCYGTGQLGLEVNPKEAFQLYTSAAKLNHAQASYRVAVCCEMGADGGGGTRRDHVKAVQFYKRAATLGDAPAMFKMGAILMKGLLGQQPNRREGIQWLKRAAERADEENPHALHELGSIYENAKSDDVIIKDERYAMELFTRAANLGYKHSQSRLGAAYEYGLMGCPIDPQKSIMWYSKAASQGEHLAEFALSGWYLTGAPPLLEASDQEAYLWARKAASSGLAKAEYAMGYYTETGIGTAPNVEEAKKWYFRAAAQSDERARNRLEEFKRGAGRKERGRVSRSGVGRQNEGECAVM